MTLINTVDNVLFFALN